MQEIVHPKGKVYYTMGEVAEMFDVNPSLLRFWEQEFDTINPRRNKKGNRLYRPQDVDSIKVIYHLVKERNMKLDVARKYIRENKDEVERDAAIMEKLLSIRAILAEIKADLTYEGEPVDDDVELVVIENKRAPEKKKVAAKEEVVPETVALVAYEEATVEVKPPFEEQPLFEIAPQSEFHSVDDAMEAFIAKHYDEEADEERPVVDPFATVPGVGKKEYDPESEEKKRPVIIEQTLF